MKKNRLDFERLLPKIEIDFRYYLKQHKFQATFTCFNEFPDAIDAFNKQRSFEKHSQKANKYDDSRR